MSRTSKTERKIKSKPKPNADQELDQALKETFPASDPPTGNQTEKKPVRPIDRMPAKIDKDLVDRLAKEVDKKQRCLDAEQKPRKSSGRSAA